MIEPSKQPLRIGILVDELLLPAWVVAELTEVIGTQVARIELVVVNKAPVPNQRRAGDVWRVSRWIANRALIPYVAYMKLENRRYKPRPDPFEPSDISHLVADVPVIGVAPKKSRFIDRFDDASVSAILAYDLDVALLLGFRILKGNALSIARHGIWSYHHGDNTRYRGGPAGFWEIFYGTTSTGAILQILTEDLDGGRVLARSRSKTNLVSVVSNRANYYWEASAMLKRELSFLHSEGKAGFDSSGESGEWSTYSQPIHTIPRPGKVMKMAAKTASRILRSKIRETFQREQWHLWYHFQPELGDNTNDNNVPNGLIYKYAPLIPPSDRYWADPFPVLHNGRHFVFCEEHRYSDRCAHIAACEIGPNGFAGSPETVLSRPYHLSYPFLFQWRGQWFMMPEASRTGAVELFRCNQFPYEWESIGQVLLDVRLVDPTLAEIDGSWWLFGATRIRNATEASALNLYHAPTPLGPWVPHRYNPVKIDACGARPAGRLFRQGSTWYRPGQDGTPRYGSAIVLHRLEEISPTRYRESVVDRIDPKWNRGLTGTHTINAAGGLSVIDARRLMMRVGHYG